MKSWHNCLDSFWHLKRGVTVYIGDQPDARTTSHLAKTWVVHNWPSQWHSKYRRGYIKFWKDQVFDLENQTIDGKKVYIFGFSVEIDLRSRTLSANVRTLEGITRLRGQDLFALRDLFREFVPGEFVPEIGSYSDPDWCRIVTGQKVRERLGALIGALSLKQAEDLAALLELDRPRTNSAAGEPIAA